VREPGGRALGSWLLRPAAGRRWTVYSGAVAPDERHAAVSYHGPDTTGADLVAQSDAGWLPCRAGRPAAGTGCDPAVHGRVVAVGSGVIASTGDGRRLLHLSYGGAITGQWDPALSGNHLVEFAADDRVLYAVGSCGYRGGLSEVKPGTGRVRVLAPPGPSGPVGREPIGAGTICGERVTLPADGLVAVAQIPTPVPQLRPGTLLLVSPRHGSVVHRVTLSAEPVDVVSGTVHR
jgi:hypothetical protein